MNTNYQFGTEEEYFLADATTRGTPRRTVKSFHDAARTRLPRVERELLQSQIGRSDWPDALGRTCVRHQTLVKPA